MLQNASFIILVGCTYVLLHKSSNAFSHILSLWPIILVTHFHCFVLSDMVVTELLVMFSARILCITGTQY